MCASEVIAAIGCCKALKPLNNRTYFVLFVFVRRQCSQKHNSNVFFYPNYHDWLFECLTLVLSLLFLVSLKVAHGMNLIRAI